MRKQVERQQTAAADLDKRSEAQGPKRHRDSSRARWAIAAMTVVKQRVFRLARVPRRATSTLKTKLFSTVISQIAEFKVKNQIQYSIWKRYIM